MRLSWICLNKDKPDLTLACPQPSFNYPGRVTRAFLHPDVLILTVNLKSIGKAYFTSINKRVMILERKLYKKIQTNTIDN